MIDFISQTKRIRTTAINSWQGTKVLTIDILPFEIEIEIEIDHNFSDSKYYFACL